jgi:hypothetical protein
VTERSLVPKHVCPVGNKRVLFNGLQQRCYEPYGNDFVSIRIEVLSGNGVDSGDRVWKTKG